MVDIWEMFRKDVKSLTEILGQCLRENGLWRHLCIRRMC